MRKSSPCLLKKYVPIVAVLRFKCSDLEGDFASIYEMHSVAVASVQILQDNSEGSSGYDLKNDVKLKNTNRNE